MTFKKLRVSIDNGYCLTEGAYAEGHGADVPLQAGHQAGEARQDLVCPARPEPDTHVSVDSAVLFMREPVRLHHKTV